ncbi:MAG: histone deacetylase family protein [Thermomicrobiales bacterium]
MRDEDHDHDAGAAGLRSTPAFATPLFMSPLFLQHNTGMHPENPGRYLAIQQALAPSGLLRGRPLPPFTPATDEQITRIHSSAHLRRLEEITAHGGGWINHDTMVDTDSLEVARLAAGAGIAAVDYALDGKPGHRHAFALGRPPGHHATPDRAMGFCLLNNVAIAAAHSLHRGVARIAIIDWDVHHGNGTQDCFYGSNNVLFCSLHQWPLYPGTGASEETGLGEGKNWTRNIPLPPGSDDLVYLDAFDRIVASAVRAAQPELIIVSAGYDAHIDDPLGGMEITTEGFRMLTQRVCVLADELCDGRLALILEGGYHPAALAASVLASIGELDRPSQ